MSDENIKDKLFSWMFSLINIHQVEYRREFVPLHDLIDEVLEKDEAEIHSTYHIDDEIYDFKICLNKKIIN